MMLGPIITPASVIIIIMEFQEGIMNTGVGVMIMPIITHATVKKVKYSQQTSPADTVHARIEFSRAWVLTTGRDATPLDAVILAM